MPMENAEKLLLLEQEVLNFAGEGVRHKKSKMYGVSNSAKVIGGGIQIGGSNLENLPGDIDSCIFFCMMRFFPDEEVYFSVHINSGLEELFILLAELVERHGETLPGGFGFASRNNNIVMAISSDDGRLYLRNKGHWEDVRQEIQGLDRSSRRGVTIDRVTVAFYPPRPGVARSQLAREFVGYLGAFVGKDKISEIYPWPREGGVSSAMTRNPLEVDLEEINRSIVSQGSHYVGGLIEKYHVGLNHNPDKHFVILSGVSGTGKSRLAVQYARAIHGLGSAEESDPFFFMCPVRPEWTDPAGLIGYHDLLSDRYIVPPFLEAIIVALANPDTPVFICLDEMNLAKVEFYLSDVLSAMESGFPMQLHSSTLPIKGSIGGEIQAAVEFPKNLYLTGTINIDETTNAISDKVLDRAVVIDMSNIDVIGYLDVLSTDPFLGKSVASLRNIFDSISTILSNHGQGFGYRLIKEAVQYHSVAVQLLKREEKLVVDELLVQKALVKLHGDESNRSMLQALATLLDQYPETLALLNRLEQDLDTFDSFQNTR